MKKIKAFTLIELLMVMIIIGILASLITTGAFRSIRSARESKAQSDVAVLETALERYKLDTGAYPVYAAGTNSFKLWLQNGDASIGWKGPYMSFKTKDLNVNTFLDPWGVGYYYRCPGSAHGATTNPFDIWSSGNDKSSGTSDDLDSWS